MTTTPAGTSQVQSLRIMTYALITSPLLILVVLYVVLPTEDAEYPPLVVIAAMLALVAGGFALAELVGFRVPAYPLGTPESQQDRQRESLTIYQARQMVRFALTEAPLMLAIVYSFVAHDYALWPYIIAIVPGMAAMAYETLPTRRNVDRIAMALEADGSPSYLREAFGHS